MHNAMKHLTVAAALVAVLAAAPTIYAHDSQGPQGSMMGQGGMMGGGSGGMMNMMPMMKQMGQMMDSCNKMMQSTTHEHGPARPNEQWREKQPEAPGTKG